MQEDNIRYVILKTIPPTRSKSKKKQKGGNDDARNKATHQSTLWNAFKTKPKYERFIGADILLTDEIYGKGGAGAPKNAKGKNFRYIVTEYSEENETFTLKYQNQAIDPDTTPMYFYTFQEEEDSAPMTDVEFETVEDGYNLFHHINGKLNAVEYEKKGNQTKIGISQ